MKIVDLDFELFWNGLTQGQNWLLTALVLVLTWFVGRFLSVAVRRTEAFIERRWDGAIAASRSRRKSRHDRKEREAAAEKIERIREERVGRKFLRRVTPDDIGMIGEVIDLHDERPDAVVVTVWSNPVGRVSHQLDYPEATRQRIAWRDLVAPSADQRKYTASHYADVEDDAVGWVEFEEIES